MIRNLDLKVKSKVVSSETSALNIGGQVPAGMKRWFTFLMFDTYMKSRASDVKLYLASVSVSNPTKASLIATGNRKYVLALEGTQLSRSNKVRPVMVPQAGPDPTRPIFSIAGGKWLGVWASVTTANVTAQYFDE